MTAVDYSRLHSYVEPCVALCLECLRFDGDRKPKNFVLDLKEALGLQRIHTKVVERVKGVLAEWGMQPIDANFNGNLPGRIQITVALGKIAFTPKQAEEFNSAVVYKHGERASDTSAGVQFHQEVDQCIDQVLAQFKNPLVPEVFMINKAPGFKSYLRRRQIDWTQPGGEEGTTLQVTIDLQKNLLTEEQRHLFRTKVIQRHRERTR